MHSFDKLLRMSGKLQLSCGIKIAYQEWGQASKRKVLALHGWLDNSNSFAYLGPYLANKGYHVMAIEHLGHGLSTQLPVGANYQFPKYVSTVKEIMDCLGWEKSSILGHSMGGAIALLYAGTYPEKVDNLMMIDGFGPVAYPSSHAVTIMRKAIDFELKSNARQAEPRQYATLSHAVDARVNVVATYPGQQSLSREAAKALLTRGCKLVAEPDSEEFILEDSAGPVVFRQDNRLNNPSFTYFNSEQVVAFASAITAPVLLVLGDNGWPIPHSAEADYANRLQCLKDKGLMTHLKLPGSHHLHLDPISAPLTAQTVSDFLEAQANKQATSRVGL